MKEPKLNLALIPHLTCLNTIPEHTWKSLSTYWNTNSWFECQKFQTRCGQGLGIWILNNPPEWFLCGCSQSHTHFEKQSLCVDIIGHFLSLNTSLGCYDTFFPLVLWAFSVCCSPFLPLLLESMPQTLSLTFSLCGLSPWAHPLAALQLGQMVPNLALLVPASWGESQSSMKCSQNSDELQPRPWTKLWSRWHWSWCPSPHTTLGLSSCP